MDDLVNIVSTHKTLVVGDHLYRGLRFLGDSEACKHCVACLISAYRLRSASIAIKSGSIQARKNITTIFLFMLAFRAH